MSSCLVLLLKKLTLIGEDFQTSYMWPAAWLFGFVRPVLTASLSFACYKSLLVSLLPTGSASGRHDSSLFPAARGIGVEQIQLRSLKSDAYQCPWVPKLWSLRLSLHLFPCQLCFQAFSNNHPLIIHISLICSLNLLIISFVFWLPAKSHLVLFTSANCLPVVDLHP